MILAPSLSAIPLDYRPLLSSFIVTLIAVPIVRRVAVSLGLFDRPDGGLKPHQRPIPYLGGVAMFLGWLAALSWTAAWRTPWAGQMSWLAAAGAVLMLTGLIDDIRHLPPRVRLFVQMGLAIALISVGIGRELSQPLLDALSGGVPHSPVAQTAQPILSALLCAFILAGATNATNLIDGMDGLCAGVLGIAAIGFIILNLLLSPAGAVHSDAEAIRSVLCMGMLGACAGFLVYNFNPASIFMGDSGSLLLGFNVAAVMILFGDGSSWRGLAGCAVVFGFPILDTALAITRRWLSRKPLFQGDRSHLYDQLRDRGLSVRRTVLISYALGALFAVLGAAIVVLPASLIMGGLLLLPLVLGWLCLRAGFLRGAAPREPSGAE